MDAQDLGAGTQDLLAWLELRLRGYAETLDAWRTHCPRLAVWEDAIADGLVCVVRDAGSSSVGLTERGRAALARAPRQ
jgi:hypothetical protein